MCAHLQEGGYSRIRHQVSAGYIDRIVGPTVPLRFSVLIGEIAHHLRSSLDHLIWQLVLANGAKGTGRTEFPIFREPPKDAEGERPFGKKIAGVRADAVKAIRQMQPYNNPEPHLDPLWLVHELDRIDKHRLLLSTVAVAHLHASRDEGAWKLMLRAPIGTPRSDAQIDDGFSIQIRIDGIPEGPPDGAVPLLAYLTGYVESVLGAFVPAFRKDV